MSLSRRTPSPRPGRLAGLITALATLVLLALPIAPAHADPFAPGYPRMGATSEAIPGHTIQSRSGQASTRLFPLHTSPGNSPDQYAYCIEYTERAKYEIQLDVGDWSTFPGGNEFAADSPVRERVAWIVHGSYPQIPLSELARRSGLDGLTLEDAITGTQGAIWALTDPDSFEYAGLRAGSHLDTASASANRVRRLIDYLTGPANSGRVESIGPSLTAPPTPVHGRAGALVGPITFASSEATVQIDSESPYPIVREDGRAIDPSRVPSGTELFLDVPAEAAAGSATMAARVVGPQYTGLLLTSIDPRSQTLMIARSEPADASATAQLSWEAVPRIATHARAEGGGTFLPGDGPATIIDTVDYEGLVPGAAYELRGEVMVPGGEAARPNGITAMFGFTPTSPSGTVELAFDLGPEVLRGEVAVVFEHLLLDGVEVASHADITDQEQTIYRPALSTRATDLRDSDQVLDHDGATVRDEVSYSGVEPGRTYRVAGELVDRATGEPTGITGTADLVPSAPTGAVTVDFEVPAGFAGRSLAVFERLYLHAPSGSATTPTGASGNYEGPSAHEDNLADNGDSPDASPHEPDRGKGGAEPGSTPDEGDVVADWLLLASHEDLDDARQTVEVDRPEPVVPTAEPSAPASTTPPTTPPASADTAPSPAPSLAETGQGDPVRLSGLGWVLIGVGAAAMSLVRRRRLAA